LFEEKLGCAPPLIGENNVCNKKFNLTTSEDDTIKQLFWDIYGTYKPANCKVPCTQTKVDAYLMFKTPNPNNPAYIFYFDPVVMVSRSAFSATTQSLLTGIGGSVGVSK
jgi:hypothetical protein